MASFEPRASLIMRASKQLRASQSLHAPVVLSGWEKVPFGAFICRRNVETRDNCWIFAQFFHKTVFSMAKKINFFLRSCTHPLIILSKNDPGMTWNAISSSFPVRTGMASEWLKNDLKCQFSSFPGMIGMTLEWLRNDWKCHFSSFLGMTGMTSEWWFDSFNAHSYHSCHSWFFCYIPWWWAMGKMRNDVEWMTKFDHFP